jgi:hypothetical protein
MGMPGARPKRKGARPAALLALPAAALALLACGSVSVSPPRSGVRRQAKSRDCAVEFLRHPPERAYEEIADVYSYFPRVVEPQEALREKACELGADAVIVTRDFLISTLRTSDRKLVAGTAIRYRDDGADPEPRG